MLIMTLFTKIVLIGWKVWWIVSLLIVIVKHHLAHKFKWPDKTLATANIDELIWFRDLAKVSVDSLIISVKSFLKSASSFDSFTSNWSLWAELSCRSRCLRLLSISCGIGFELFINSLFLSLLSSSSSFLSLLKLLLVPVN